MPYTVQSLTAEKEALDAAHDALAAELLAESFQLIPDEERNRMAAQRDLMKQHSLILQERIRYAQEHPDGMNTEEEQQAPVIPTV